MSKTQTTLKKLKRKGEKKERDNIEKDKTRRERKDKPKQYVCCGARGSFVQNI